MLWAVNWKMMGSQASLKQALINYQALPEGHEVIMLLPFAYLGLWQSLQADGQVPPRVYLGAQAVSEFEEGAYTGECSAQMLVDVGCEYVCLGHSERRQYRKEINKQIACQYQQAVKQGLKPILCVGETADEKSKGLTERVLRDSLSSVFLCPGFQSLVGHDIIIAYEPVWSIGSKSACLQWVDFAVSIIRSFFDRHNVACRHKPKVCYGGGVDRSLVTAASSVGLDGYLVGRLSHQPEQFMEVVTCCT